MGLVTRVISLNYVGYIYVTIWYTRHGHYGFACEKSYGCIINRQYGLQTPCTI
ncbi:hypothetical protein BJX96DRAFT_70695 [Aspergillus floccosus]